MLSFECLAALPLLFVVCACSVKENRTDCPCCLGLDYSDCTVMGDELVLTGWKEDLSESFRDTPFPANPGGYGEYSVPKCDFTVLSVAGAGLSCLRQVKAGAGSQADSIYAGIDRFSTRYEYCYRKLSLHKQFMTLRIFLAVLPDSSDYEDLLVESGTCGLSLETLEGIPGTFLCRPDKIAAGTYGVRLYRQCDDRLALTIFSSAIPDGSKVIDLAGLLSQCGYDWSDESLSDVDLQIDKALCRVTVKIMQWSEKQEIIMEI